VTTKLLWVLIPAHAASILFLNVLHPEWIGLDRPAASIEGLGTVVLIALGYTLFVWYIAGEGSRSLRLRTELALAQQIHEQLVPPIDVADGRVMIHGASVAGAEMGGDLVDVVVGEDRTDVLIVDVSGHGVRAGVVMAMVKSAIRTLMHEGPGLDRLQGSLNRVLSDLTPDQMFATFAAVRFFDGGRAEVGLAGHLPIMVRRAATGEVESIENESLPLGVSPAEAFATRDVRLSPGDTVALYTDGLMETADASGAMFGLDGLRRVFGEWGGGGLPEAHERIMAAVAAHGPQLDDRTLVLARVAGSARDRGTGAGTGRIK